MDNDESAVYSLFPKLKYDYAVKMKLDKLSEIGFDLKEIYRRLNR